MMENPDSTIDEAEKAIAADEYSTEKSLCMTKAEKDFMYGSGIMT